VRDEVYRVATRLGLQVFVVSNFSRPIRPPGLANVRMVMVGDASDAADDWIAEHLAAHDVCITADIPLAARCLAKGGSAVAPNGKVWTEANIGNALAGAARQAGPLAVSVGARYRGAAGVARGRSRPAGRSIDAAVEDCVINH
jgi:uncharacterized protein